MGRTGEPPLVSVVLPTLDRSRWLPRSIGSVLRQTWNDLELIVVDDGSTEDIAALVNGYGDPRVRYVRHDRNLGVAAARNTGVEAARGRYIAFQDSDDEWLLGKLEAQLADLQPLDGTRMALCGVLRMIGDATRGDRRVLTYPRTPTDWSHGVDPRIVLASAVAYTQSWLVPKTALLAAGGFDTRLRVWDDWDLLIRLSKQVAIRARLEPLVVSARSDRSLSDDPARFAHDLPVILNKYADDLRTRPVDHASLRKLLATWLYRAKRWPEARAAAWESICLRPAQSAAWSLLARAFLRETLT